MFASSPANSPRKAIKSMSSLAPTNSDEPQIVPIADGARVIHLDAGPPDAPKEDLDSYTAAFVEAV